MCFSFEINETVLQKLKIQQQELLRQQQQQAAAALQEEKGLAQLDKEEQEMAAAKGFAPVEKDSGLKSYAQMGDYDDDADMPDITMQTFPKEMLDYSGNIDRC